MEPCDVVKSALTDISDLACEDWPHPTALRLLLIECSCRRGRTSRPSPLHPEFRLRTRHRPQFSDTSPESRPFFALDDLLPPLSVSRLAPAAPGSAEASTRIGGASGDSPPAGASSTGRA